LITWPSGGGEDFIDDVSGCVAITHVIYYGSEAPNSGHLLRSGTMCHTTATRGLLSATASSGSIPTPATVLLLPAPSSSLQRYAACPSLLLPASNSQGTVRRQSSCGAAWLAEVKVCAKSPLAVPYSTSSFQIRSETEVLSNASAPSCRVGIAQAEGLWVF